MYTYYGLSKMKWISFDRHVSQFKSEVYWKGLAILTWPKGIASEEDLHGAAQLLTPSIADIRKAFKFRWVHSAQCTYLVFMKNKILPYIEGEFYRRRKKD